MQTYCCSCTTPITFRSAGLRPDQSCCLTAFSSRIRQNHFVNQACSGHCRSPVPLCMHTRSTDNALPIMRHSLAPATSFHFKQQLHATSSCLQALQDDNTGILQPSVQPLALCKRWLLNVVPLLRNEELVSRAAWTLMIIAMARLGLYLRLPYLDTACLPRNLYAGNAVESLFGGAMQMPYNVFLLGVGPIINASIITSTVMALPGPWDALPGFRARIDSLKDSGHEGHAVIHGYTNLLGLVMAVVTGVSEGIKLAPFARHTSGVPFVLLTMIILAAGTSILRWLSDSVEARGLGDGITLLIALNIVSHYSVTLNKAALIVGAGKVSPATVGMLAAAYMCLVMLAVFINSLSLRLPLIYYKQRRSKAPQASVQKRAAAAAAVGSTKQVKPNNAYLPISLNPNGMQALLFASLLYQLPEIVSVFSVRGQIWMSNLLTTSKWYPFIYGFVVFLFGMVQLGESTPMQMTKYLNAIEAGVQNVSPGPATEKFLKRKMRSTRLWGALLVAILATAAQCFDRVCERTLGTSLGCISLLLIVGLITSCIRQVQSLLQLPQLERALQRERSVLQRISST